MIAPEKPLPVVVPPIAGEALGSWLVRVVAPYNVSVGQLLNYVGVHHPRVNAAGWAHIGPLLPEQLRKLAVPLRVKSKALAAMNTSPWAVRHIASEIGFCPRCLEEDRASDQPMYWRRIWQDAFSTVCLQHRIPLSVIAAPTLRAVGDWRQWREMLSLATHFDDPSENSFAQHSWPLQCCVQELKSPDNIYRLFGLRSGHEVRQVANDLLDALLSVNFHEKERFSILARFALLQNIDVHQACELSIRIMSHRPGLVTRIKSFRARVMALAAAQMLMLTSLQARVTGTTPLYSPQAFRDEWLWPLISDSARRRLFARSASWPRPYVNQCWPELSSGINIALVRRNKIPRSFMRFDAESTSEPSSFS